VGVRVGNDPRLDVIEREEDGPEGKGGEGAGGKGLESGRKRGGSEGSLQDLVAEGTCEARGQRRASIALQQDNRDSRAKHRSHAGPEQDGPSHTSIEGSVADKNDKGVDGRGERGRGRHPGVTSC
jgi:hypothetical protein